MKDILDKLDMGVKLFIIAVFGISVIYCVLSVVFGLFRDDKVEDQIDINDIEKYIIVYSEETGETKIDTSKVVKNYSIYYTVESAMKNFIQALLDEDYSKTYNILSTEMKEKYSKKEYLKNIEEFTSENFLASDIIYDINYSLKKIYNIAECAYVCECNTVNESSVKIGLLLDESNQTYTVFYIEFK